MKKKSTNEHFIKKKYKKLIQNRFLKKKKNQPKFMRKETYEHQKKEKGKKERDQNETLIK